LEENKKDRWRKIKDILKTLIKNSVSGDFLDLLFVLFFLMHMTWIPDSISDFIKEEPADIPVWLRAVHPVIYMTGLIGVIFLKPYIKKREEREILVVLSGISLIALHSLEPFLEPFKKHLKIERLYVFVDRRIKVNSLQGLETKKTYSCLKALDLISNAEMSVTALRDNLCTLEEYSVKNKDDAREKYGDKFLEFVDRGEIKIYRLQLVEIEKALVASENIYTVETAFNQFKDVAGELDKDVGLLNIFKNDRERNKYESIKKSDIKKDLEVVYENTGNDSLRLWIVKQFLKEIISEKLSNNIEIQLIESDYDEIPQNYRKISDLVNELTAGKYKDENLLFNITPGTANISVALALNSIKGNRICAYKEQNGNIKKDDGTTNKEFREENLNIYDLKDIFSELIDG
jgi:hypothetical protein